MTTPIPKNMRFRHLPPANEEPAHPLASYYCDECGNPDWIDTHKGGGIREFYADEEMGDSVCEPCMHKRQQAHPPTDACPYCGSTAENKQETLCPTSTR